MTNISVPISNCKKKSAKHTLPFTNVNTKRYSMAIHYYIYNNVTHAWVNDVFMLEQKCTTTTKIPTTITGSTINLLKTIDHETVLF